MAITHAQLKAFHAVAVHGGFTRAAQRLFLTQPAVSDQVRKLEEHFGVLLFHRNKRTVQLSELGERLLAITQRLFTVEAEAEELLSSSRALQTGSLTLAVDSTVHLRPYIARFYERYPGIALSLVTGNSEASLQRLFDYRADFAIVGCEVSDVRMITRALSDDPMVAFVTHSHPLAKRETVKLKDLAGLPMVMRERGSMTRRILEAEMARAGLDIVQAIEVDGREAANEMVAAGIGIGVVSVAEFGSDQRVKALPIVDCQGRMSETLVCLREQTSRRILQAFMEVVEEVQST